MYKLMRLPNNTVTYNVHLFWTGLIMRLVFVEEVGGLLSNFIIIIGGCIIRFEKGRYLRSWVKIQEWKLGW